MYALVEPPRLGEGDHDVALRQRRGRVPEHHGWVIHEEELDDGRPGRREDAVREASAMHAHDDLGAAEERDRVGDGLFPCEDPELGRREVLCNQLQ